MGNTPSSEKLLNKLHSSYKKKKEESYHKITTAYSHVPPMVEDWKVKKGDLLEIIGETEQWLYVRKLSVKSRRRKLKKGYIPLEFIKPVKRLEAEQWYFPNVTKRIQATKYLLRKEAVRGHFLVWKHPRGERYCLSVRRGENVKHFRIKKVKRSFGLTSKETFPTISELVESYSKDSSGICGRLRMPCVKVMNQSSPAGHEDKQWEVDRESFKKVKRLGRGEFGEVWKGVWNGIIEVAIKEFKARDPEILNEIEVMKRLNHRHVLKLHAICTVDEPICLIMELMKNGSLYRYLRNHSKMKGIRFPSLLNFAIQIAAGMAYLEVMGIVHRDLRADNVLLDDFWCCKVADFGLAQDASSGEQTTLMSTKLPVKWTAPEIFTSGKYTIKCDVWSFGILLTEIVTFGEEPYADQDKTACVKAVKKGYRMPKPPNCPESLYKIMLLCWSSNSVERPGFFKLQDMLKAEI